MFHIMCKTESQGNHPTKIFDRRSGNHDRTGRNSHDKTTKNTPLLVHAPCLYKIALTIICSTLCVRRNRKGIIQPKYLIEGVEITTELAGTVTTKPPRILRCSFTLPVHIYSH